MGGDPFGTPVSALRGVGPARTAALDAKGVRTVLDLLLLTPTRYEAPPPPKPPETWAVGDDVATTGKVVAARQVRSRRGRAFADLRLDVGGRAVRACFFNRGWLAERAPKGTWALVWGRATSVAPPTLSAAGLRVLAAPEEAAARAAELEPRRPAVPGVAEGVLRGLVREALDATRAAPDPLPDDLRTARGLPTLADALRRVHEPATLDEASEGAARLLFDRLLALALASRARGEAGAAPAPRIVADAKVRARIDARLPFRLTPGQRAALDEILADLARPVAMRRLLLGDVGSGKTAVAVGALLAATAAGRQGLLVAPTDVLAAQHARTLSQWLAGSRVRHALIAAGVPRAERRRAEAAAAAGELDLVVGTHAALSDAVLLPRLGLAVVDEQHRFGVLQRLKAREKGERPHLLALSATPIPRSLALALFGDLAVTRLAGRPAGRGTPTATTCDAASALLAVREAVARGERAYVVFPAVTSETAPALEREGRALTARRGALAGLRTATLHGGLPPAERAAALDAFRSGDVDVLLCTTIVEVGVDVPEATTLVVFGADRFGLATLHQLRGRVGRGERPGSIRLVPTPRPAADSGASSGAARDATARLALLQRESDGFRLAEADLFLRGPGEICGLRQHGHGGALPLREGRDRGFLEAASETAGALKARGYDPDADGYYARLARALGGVRFDPPDAV
ncbi:MAG TPA: helicase-related protein [Planctomycetota bacterium]|nr:helicase-related protein [Planctomycetota bacterium]